MNWEAMKSYLPLYEKACILTLKIGWIGILFAIVIGLFCALIRHYKVPVLSTIAGGYIEFFRNTPLLVQLFFLYFGLPKLGISIGAEFCGVLGLALLGGAYMAEAFRSGLESVEQIQMESALSLGMSRQQAVFGIRGANGVILITTKRGKEGKPKISFSTSASILQPTRWWNRPIRISMPLSGACKKPSGRSS